MQTLNVLGGDSTEAIIMGLTSATIYTIEVAAVNNAGTGEYSNSITAVTGGKGSCHRSLLAHTLRSRSFPYTTQGDAQQSTEGAEYAASARSLIVYVVGGVVIGVLITAVLAAVILVVFVRRAR